MIRPPYFSEVLRRHTAAPSTGDWLRFCDLYLCRHRWTDAVLVVGDPDAAYEAALGEFFPDADLEWAVPAAVNGGFVRHHLRTFNVVLLHSPPLFDLLKPVVREWGLLAAEGVESTDCRYEGTVAIHLPTGE